MIRGITILLLAIVGVYLYPMTSDTVIDSKPIVNQSRDYLRTSVTVSPSRGLSEKEEIINYIKIQAFKNDIDVTTALKIADCESDFIPDAKNPNSTAKGIYQFINGTWRDYCAGNVFDYKDNVDCFIKYFNKNKGWWKDCLP